MTRININVLGFVLIIAVLFTCHAGSAQKQVSSSSRIGKLEHEVGSLSEGFKSLEARISALEILGMTSHSNEEMRRGMIQASKDALINDINNLAANAYVYRIRPASMGGGKGSYVGYKIPYKLARNGNGEYEAIVLSDSVIIFTGTSGRNLGNVKAVLNKEGRLGSFEYTGEFQ